MVGTLAEWRALSEGCDYLVISKSGFGITAAAVAQEAYGAGVWVVQKAREHLACHAQNVSRLRLLTERHLGSGHL